MNMTVTDRSNHKTTRCVCGATMVHKVDTITRMIRGQEIRIHHVPFYECSRCGEKVFDLSTRISSIAVGAYKRGVSDVIWSPGLYENE